MSPRGVLSWSEWIGRPGLKQPARGEMYARGKDLAVRPETLGGDDHVPKQGGNNGGEAELAAWLSVMQGVELDEALLREPAATARRLSGLAGAADAALPFGAEPAGFYLAQAALRRGGEKT